MSSTKDDATGAIVEEEDGVRKDKEAEEEFSDRDAKDDTTVPPIQDDRGGDARAMEAKRADTSANVASNVRENSKKRTESVEVENKNQKRGGILRNLGEFLESSSLQSGMVYLILIEVLSAIAAALIDAGADIGIDKQNVRIMRPVLDILMLCSIFASVIEIAALLVVFRHRILGHVGYVFDVVLVGIIVRSFLMSGVCVPAVHIISILRMWRLLRIYVSDMANEQREHDKTRAKLVKSQNQVAALRLEKETAERLATKEAQARKSVENMLNDYKNRVEQYGEALRIAAVTVAKAQESAAASGSVGEVVAIDPDREDEDNLPTADRIVVADNGTYEMKARANPIRRRRTDATKEL